MHVCVCVHVCAFCVLKFGDIRGGREPHVNMAMSNEAEFLITCHRWISEKGNIYIYIVTYMTRFVYVCRMYIYCYFLYALLYTYIRI